MSGGACFKTLFAFEADATALVPDVLNVDFEDEYEELEADLQEFSEKFADSPAAQVCATAKNLVVFFNGIFALSSLACLCSKA